MAAVIPASAFRQVACWMFECAPKLPDVTDEWTRRIERLHDLGLAILIDGTLKQNTLDEQGHGSCVWTLPAPDSSQLCLHFTAAVPPEKGEVQSCQIVLVRPQPAATALSLFKLTQHQRPNTTHCYDLLETHGLTAEALNLADRMHAMLWAEPGRTQLAERTRQLKHQLDF